MEDGQVSMSRYIIFHFQTARARIPYLNDSLVLRISGETFVVAQGMFLVAAIVWNKLRCPLSGSPY